MNHRRAGRENWITTNWDLWSGSYFAGDDLARFSQFMSMAIETEEGSKALEDILSLPSSLSQVIISTHDLQSRVDVWVNGLSAPGASTQAQHKRPDLTTTYVEVDGDLEAAIAGVLSRILGIETIGRDDDFFEMGGHSILAVQAAVQIADIAPRGAPSVNLYDTPTIRSLAEAMAQLAANA
jgi:hypothetical protein